MPKIFYTERDVDEMQNRGITSIDVTENVVMTDLALERAMKYEMKINRVQPSSAPTAKLSQSVNLAVSSVHTMPERAIDSDLKQKIKSMVLAKLDGQVDAVLLDSVISRVLDGMK
ncbi:MAG TPA: hypothetical protein VFR47_28010 [Anaerolineales bacterium]|nr:hypothetical protein [Anaerolineales bacterium]